MSRAFWRYAPVFLVGTLAPVTATQLGVDAFQGATIVDFEVAPDAPVGGFYANLGVTMVNLNGGRFFDTGSGAGDSRVACNYPPLRRVLPAGELLFDAPMQRVGFYITTNPTDDVTVTAYLDGAVVGSELFDTGGSGAGGSFAGVEFAAPFDRVVIDPANNTNSFFCIDDLRFSGASSGITVEIDIRPGTQPNPVNSISAGVIPVAILSSAEFDAPAEVDRASLTFGSSRAEAGVAGRGRPGAQRPACAAEDVNRDGRTDLLCRFETRAAGFERGDTEGTVKGETLEGVQLTGTDAVVVVRRPTVTPSTRTDRAPRGQAAGGFAHPPTSHAAKAAATGTVRLSSSRHGTASTIATMSAAASPAAGPRWNASTPNATARKAALPTQVPCPRRCLP